MVYGMSEVLRVNLRALYTPREMAAFYTLGLALKDVNIPWTDEDWNGLLQDLKETPGSVCRDNEFLVTLLVNGAEAIASNREKFVAEVVTPKELGHALRQLEQYYALTRHLNRPSSLPLEFRSKKTV